MTYRILTFDGGGTRGVFTAVLLKRLAAAVPTLIDKADLVAGTSTGALIALGLGLSMTPKKIEQLYIDEVPNIFNDSWLDNLRDLGQIAGAQYGTEERLTAFRRFAGKKTLGALTKKIVVPTFDLDDVVTDSGKRVRTWRPKFFHNFPGTDDDSHETVLNVAMRTSAAPTYFPTYQGYVDGGVVANNPSLSALATALDKRAGNQLISDVVLLSLGTGQSPNYVDTTKQEKDWGFAQWAQPLVSIMIDGSMGVADFQCRQLLGDNYCRVGPYLPKAIGLDSKELDLVRGWAANVNLDDTVRWLKTHW
jgi:patatin-like phospholipase/acyl hydrolase